MKPQNTTSASHQARGYKHWQSPRQRGSTGTGVRVLLKRLLTLSELVGGLRETYYHTACTHDKQQNALRHLMQDDTKPDQGFMID